MINQPTTRGILDGRPHVQRSLLLCLCLWCAAALTAQPSAQPRVLQIDLHDTLQTERASVFARQIERANDEGYQAILIDLSTPGGMVSAADAMVDAMHMSRIPLIAWAGWSQTRISGEGLRLLAAADVALLGSDTFVTPLWTDRPHGLSSEVRAARSEQLASSLRAEVADHHRNPAIVAALSSGGHWFTATEATAAGFVDGVAEKRADALRVANGRTLFRDGKTAQLHLSGARVDIAAVKPQELLLLTLMNPDLSVLLLTLGLLLVYLEINTPGTVIPGAVGILLIMLAIYALHLLPLSWLGIALCLTAVLLLVLEARFAAHGVIACLGVVLLVLGLRTLVQGPLPQLQVHWGTALGAGIGFGGMTASLVVLGITARRAKVKTGSDAMLGWLAVAQTALAPEGQILVRGELWRARLTTRDSFVAAGDRVKVLRADGLTLEVTAVPLSGTA